METTNLNKGPKWLTMGDIPHILDVERAEAQASDWAVDKHGNMEHKRTGYCITADRLAENWLEHMSEKTWVKMDTFVRAYIRACYIARVNTVQITY